MDKASELLLVIATYNEIDSLPSLIEQIRSQIDADVLVIDDNSPDGTGNWCDDHAAKDSAFEVIHRSGKLGLGSAAMVGFKLAIERGYQWVGTMDADLSHDPEVLKEMLKLINQSSGPDVVIGSRYVKGGQILGWPWYRRISSALVNGFARFVLRLSTRDNTSAFRIYDVSKLSALDLEIVVSSGYAYLEEILVLLKKQNATFAEVPICFQNRETGRSKVNLQELVSSLYQILRLSFRS